MSTLVDAEVAGQKKGRKTAIVDTDVHILMPDNDTMLKYLPKQWHRHNRIVGSRGCIGSGYPRLHNMRRDAWPSSGGGPGTDLDFLRKQLLDEWEIDYGMLTPLMGAGGQLNLEYGAAMAQAVNDWQAEEWVAHEPRLKGSILTPYEDGELAEREIGRMADHPDFVQLLLSARTKCPLGHRKYWKMYEAAERYDLPVAVHFGGRGGGPITGAGWPSHYIEDHVGNSQTLQNQVASFVFEGIFERFPTLRIVIIECGFAWLPPLMWRLDECWRRLGEEVPHVQKPPSEYIREHIWISTQPMEEPPDPAYFDQLLEQMDMYDKIMFATDYPHWDFDAPDQALPSGLNFELRRAIMAENARKLYRLD